MDLRDFVGNAAQIQCKLFRPVYSFSPSSDEQRLHVRLKKKRNLIHVLSIKTADALPAFFSSVFMCKSR